MTNMMNAKIKAILLQTLIFIVVCLVTSLMLNFLFEAIVLKYKAGIIGGISGLIAVILSPKIKTIESQSGQQIQITSVFMKGARFLQ